jgi:peptidoglycan/xylan/chitin deacetylase (PgdA/CDA1 family)
LPILRKYGFVATFYIITGRIGSGSNLSWDQAAEMAKDGMEIGSHTVSHVNVQYQHGSDLAHQIGDSATAIQTNLSARGVIVTVTTFCYPFGGYSAEAETYLQTHGFLAAFTEIPGAVRPSMNMEQLPRVRVSRGESPTTLLGTIAQS